MSLIGKSPRLEPTLGNDVATDSDYNTYRIQTRGEYEELMTEFEFRCKRSAMINNHEASSYERIVYWTELVAALLGAVSVSTLGMWLFHWQSSVVSLASFAQLGSLGVLGLVIAFIIELLSKGGEKIIPSFSKRAEAHIKAGAAWQRLAQKTRSYRIQLDNPKLDISTFAEWYDHLIEQKEKLSYTVIIAQSTFRMFDDPKRIFTTLKHQRQLYLQFVALEKMDVKDLHEKYA